MTVSLAAVRAAVRPAVERDVTRRIEAVRQQAEVYAHGLGKYDSTRTDKLYVYRNGFRTRAGNRNTPDKIHRQCLNIAKHANIVEHGSRGHMIYPGKTSEILAWTWLDGSQFIGYPGLGVLHPGTKPQNILRQAARAASV